MSEIFNFHRFGTYFLYDLRQMWRKHSRAAILIGGSVMLFIPLMKLAKVTGKLAKKIVLWIKSWFVGRKKNA